MATQVVMFSVLLFGTSGIVLDFGRVYSEHGNMQSFTDQAALAAAAELDRSPDSISRAVEAVFGGVDAEGNELGSPITKSAVFSSGTENQFNISHLVFLSDLPNDGGAQTSMTGIQSDIEYVAFADGGSNGDEATAALTATYVIAVAEERSVSNTLISLINSGAETAAASSNIVRTVAAAKRRVKYCGEFSNLVMCSPRGSLEGYNSAADSEGGLGDFMDYFRGARFAHVADQSGLSTSQRLYRRRNPAIDAPDEGGMVSVGGVAAVCNTLNAIPGGLTATSDSQLARYQAICHLAATQRQDHCVGETIEIVAAEPEVITTALNVTFNMWDEPINEVIEDWPSNGFAIHMPNYQPDMLVMKGKVWETDPAARDATNLAFGLGNNHASRLHYKEYVSASAGTSTAAYNLILPDCLRVPGNEGSCGVAPSMPGYAPYIGFPATLTALTNYYQTNYPVHFQYVGGQNVPSNVDTFYDMYLEERDWSHAKTDIISTVFIPPFTFQTTTHATAGESLAFSGEDASLALFTPSPELAYQTNDLQTLSDNQNVTATYPTGIVGPDDLQTRRRMSVPMVDCGALGTPDANGVMEAQVLDFVDIFLLQPPRPTCGVAGNDQCNNALVTSATVMSELIGKSNYQQNAFPELVR